MNTERMKSLIDENESFQSRLFCRGFFVTNDKNIDCNIYPFYGKWKHVGVLDNSVNIYVHPKMTFYMEKKCEDVLVLIGHAFNPFSGITDENVLLKDLLESVTEEEVLFEKINQLTGTFALFMINKDGIRFLNDTVGLQSVFYTLKKSCYYVASHVNLIGDLLGIEEDTDVTKLKNTKYFHLFGNQLPGNITTFKDVWRLVPNHYVLIGNEMLEKRFYYPHYEEFSFDEACTKSAEILKNTMKLIAEKWENPAISLTGGVDSKTTLASALEYKERYKYFSYDSQKNEAPDVEAAKMISKNLGLSLIVYDIPYENDSFEEFDQIREIMNWNCGNVCYNNLNDVRKRIYLEDIPDFDCEVKSWASEVGRSRYTKRYNGRRKFGNKPTPRKCNTFYKFLFFDRKALHKVDAVFKDYLNRFFEQSKENAIPWQDQFYWEWHWPSRDGVILTCEQKYAHEITVPYNNRKLLEILLSVSEEDRINDRVYKVIRDTFEPKIDESCEEVIDVNRTKLRAKAEDFYYIVNNILP